MVNNSRLYIFYRAPTPALPLVSTVMDLTVHGSRHRYSRLKIDAEKKKSISRGISERRTDKICKIRVIVIEFLCFLNRYDKMYGSTLLLLAVRTSTVVTPLKEQTNKQPNKTTPPPQKKKHKKQNKTKQKQKSTN